MTIEEQSKKRLQEQERERLRQEHIATLDPASAELIQGYRKRIQKAGAEGKSRESEYEAVSNYAATHGKISRRVVWDREGRANTEYIWTGTKADGSKGSTSLMTVQGMHSVDDYNRRFNKLKVLSSNVDIKSSNFNNTVRFLFGRDSVYAPTEQESRAFQTVRRLSKDLRRSGWEPKGGWSEAAGGSTASTAASGPTGQNTETAPAAPEPRYSVIANRDEAWLGGRQLSELNRSEQLLYTLGIGKDDWGKQDRAGQKALLAQAIYGADGTGWNTPSFKEATGLVADFYKAKGKRAKAQMWSDASRGKTASLWAKHNQVKLAKPKEVLNG